MAIILFCYIMYTLQSLSYFVHRCSLLSFDVVLLTLSFGYLFSSNIRVESLNRTVIQDNRVAKRNLSWCLDGCCVVCWSPYPTFFKSPITATPPPDYRIINYQLLAHFTFRFAISVSSSSLAKTRIAAMAMTGEQAMMTLPKVQTYSMAVSISII